MKLSNARWNVFVLAGTLMFLGIFGGTTAYIDPFFHYHAPLEVLSYSFNNQRYQNDGILRNFDYNAIIIGTSMMENFKTSEFDELFSCHSVNTSFSGGRYKEINDNLARALSSKQDIEIVLRCLDYTSLVRDKDAIYSDAEYPEYLTNDNPFDDVNYLFNREVLISESLHTLKQTFDEEVPYNSDKHSSQNTNLEFGREVVLDSYTLGEKVEEEQIFNAEDRIRIQENIRQNVTVLADKYPNVTFLLFFPPYSICYWDELSQNGQVNWRIDAEQCAIEELLQHSNIQLFSFCTDYSMVCDLNNYKDQVHYGEWISSDILHWIKAGTGLLTEDNYREYIDDIRTFYNSYDYESLHE